MLALKEILRAKARFGLLAGALGLLVFLLLFLNSISNQLVQSLIGALENSTADVLVVSDEAQGALPASRLDPEILDEVAAVQGVDEAVGIGLLSATVSDGSMTEEATLWGIPVDGPGFPDDLVDGRFPESPGEMVVDTGAMSDGFEIGTTVTLSPSGTTFEIVGVVRNASYFISTTGYVSLDDWQAAFEAQFPGSPSVPLTAVGVRTAGDADPAEVALAVTESIDGVEGLTPEGLAEITPGVDSLTQSFGLILGITFLVVVLLVGFFFLILTVQKLRPFTVLRALGAPTAQLGRAVALQIVVTVSAGVAVGTLGLWLASLASTPEFTIRFDPSPILVVTVAIVVSSLAAGLLSIRRIARQDPADAAFGGGR